MKYLVVKGWLGFGDRLETLKMAVHYALQHNLQIYVDWTDSMWSHDKEDFYTYFQLQNIPQLHSLDDIPEDATVLPNYWKDNLKTAHFTKDLIKDINSKKIARTDVTLGILKGNYDADVIVCASIGDRFIFNDCKFFTDVCKVKDTRIINTVRERQLKYKLNQCIGIHIRGTDRVKSAIKRAFNIQVMAINAVNNGALNGRSMISVSDDKESETIWRNFFPQTISLSGISLNTALAKGNHNATKDELNESKDSMNVDMLVDFFTLASCSDVLSTFKDSRFAKEARRIHINTNSMLGI